MTYQSGPDSPQSGLSLSPPAVSVTTASGQVLAGNKNRRKAILINDSAQVIYLARGMPAALNAGIRLNPAGGSWIEEPDSLGHVFTGPIFAIAAATSNLLVTEEI